MSSTKCQCLCGSEENKISVVGAVIQYFQEELRLSKVSKGKKGENAPERENSLSRGVEVGNTHVAVFAWLAYGMVEDTM